MMKRILILTAGFGEGHNSAARGVRAGLARVAPKVEVELRDLFPETFGALTEIVRLRLQLARSKKRFRPTIPTLSRPQEKSRPPDRSFSTGRRRLDLSALSLFVAADPGK